MSTDQPSSTPDEEPPPPASSKASRDSSAETIDTTGGEAPADPSGSNEPDAPPSPDDTGRGWDFTPPPVATKERSYLGRVTVGIALVAVGALWLLNSLGTVSVSGVQLMGTALLVVGVGLLVGAFFGRARGLIVVGLVIVPLVIAAALFRPYSEVLTVDSAFRDGAGDVTASPTAAADVRDEYRLAGGRYVVDLSAVDFGAPHDLGDPPSIAIEMGVGELILRLPDDVTAIIDASLGVGELRMLNRSSAGVGLQRNSVITVGDGAHTIEITMRLGVGQLTVAALSGVPTQEADR
ncbi:MAG: hypothetical protein WD007_01260 [Nitriliruptoraceae bacterium]